ncbi:MAG: trypsin-like peptidase domain-containing protein [Candidatus Moranbacteria bacterium]|nr:trypsin-like peptidase domain-containing protein [Candidatus Moranbacteria bacterium]
MEDVSFNSDEQKKIKTSSLSVAVVATIVIVSSLSGAAFGFMASGLERSWVNNKNVTTANSVASEALTEQQKEEARRQVVHEDEAIISVVKESSPAVVSIIVSKDIPRTQNFFFGDPFGLFDNGTDGFGQQGETQKREVGGGSGFFATSDGMIVTNKHVVSDPSADYTVVTNSGDKYEATIVAQDPVQDIAIVKVEGNNFPVLPLGNSEELRIGQTVIAIGNSLAEFANSVSRGIVSGLGRNIVAGSGFGQSERLTNIIQTDAAINPGNSGGPLLDIAGKVIGVNTAVAQGAENIGFALPIERVKKVIEQVKESGRITTPFIGVRYVIINEELAKQENLPVDYGVLVARGETVTDFAVLPGSPADKAGIMENDIILEVEGEKITQDNQLSDMIAGLNPGEQISVTLLHRGEKKTVNVTLEERKQ